MNKVKYEMYLVREDSKYITIEAGDMKDAWMKARKIIDGHWTSDLKFNDGRIVSGSDVVGGMLYQTETSEESGNEQTLLIGTVPEQIGYSEIDVFPSSYGAGEKEYQDENK